MILMDHSRLRIEQPRKMEMLFDHVGQWHCILDEAFNVEEQIILVLVQIIEANGTLQPTHDSGRSDRVIVVVASRWLGLPIFLIVIVLLLGRLLLDCLLLRHLLLVVAASRCPGLLVFLLIIVLLLGHLLLSRLLLDHLLPQERDKPCIQGFIEAEIPTSLVLQLFNTCF
jgi:hypothetical protein